jgi:subtilisin family serine protease
MRPSHIIIFLFVLVLISSLSTTDHILQSNVSQASGFSRVIHQANTPSYNELIAKAQTKGMVRIIVGLNVPFQPEGDVSRSQAIQQRQRIAHAQDQLIQRISSYNITFLKKLSIIPYMILEVDELALQKLASDPEVASIEEDVFVPPTLSESISLIGADTVWSFGYSGAGQTVAILDSGIDRTHPFLSGKVVAEACYSTNSALDNATTVCPNGLEEQIGSGAGINCSTVISGCDHGTHVAGIAAGNGADFSGVANDATIIAVQVFSRIEDNAESAPCADVDRPSPCALTSRGDQLEALAWVYTLRNSYNIAAVNMSLAGENLLGHAIFHSLQ